MCSNGLLFSVSGYATIRPLNWISKHCGVGSCHGEANFGFARQLPTIVTWAELDFYDLPLIRPSGFVNSGRQRSSSQELLGDGRRYDYIGCYSIFCLSYRIGMLSRSRKPDFKAFKDCACSKETTGI